MHIIDLGPFCCFFGSNDIENKILLLDYTDTLMYYLFLSFDIE